jgi:hypothetical protein
MATEHKILHGPLSHIGTLVEQLNEAAADGFEVQHFAASPGELHVLLARETKDDAK